MIKADKTFLIGMLAHDLRSPLNTISGFAEVLEVALADRLDPRERSFLSTIRECSQSMLLLIEDTLTLSALESGQITLDRAVFDLAELAQRVARLQASAAEYKGVRLVLEQPAEPLSVHLDWVRLEQVLNNLVHNALKFSYSGSMVRLVLADGPGQSVTLQVSDQGTGIPEDVKDSLFEPFTKGRRMGTAGESSTGLGLAICSKIVTAHGGTIEVDSTLDHGTIVTVILPRYNVVTDQGCSTQPATA